MRSMPGKMFLQLLMKGVHFVVGAEPQGNSPLIAHHEDGATRVVQRGNGRFDSGKNVQLTPPGDVLAFGRFAIDHPVAVEEDESNVVEMRRHRGAPEPGEFLRME